MSLSGQNTIGRCFTIMCPLVEGDCEIRRREKAFTSPGRRKGGRRRGGFGGTRRRAQERHVECLGGSFLYPSLFVHASGCSHLGHLACLDSLHWFASFCASQDRPRKRALRRNPDLPWREATRALGRMRIRDAGRRRTQNRRRRREREKGNEDAALVLLCWRARRWRWVPALLRPMLLRCKLCPPRRMRHWW